jgi:hypothetical protein
MLGSATFTIVMSSSSIRIPRHTVPKVHHFCVMSTSVSRRLPRSGGGGRIAPAISPVFNGVHFRLLAMAD